MDVKGLQFSVCVVRNRSAGLSLSVNDTNVVDAISIVKHRHECDMVTESLDTDVNTVHMIDIVVFEHRYECNLDFFKRHGYDIVTDRSANPILATKCFPKFNHVAYLEKDAKWLRTVDDFERSLEYIHS
jgi:hypothetical protein